MPKLNQIIAILNGKKTQSQKTLTEIYKRLQKPALFEGIARTYQPLDEDGEQLPAERKNVQYSVKDAVAEAREAVVDLFNVAATQDWSNCEAKADVKIDNQVIVEQVPVTYLLFLEKRLTDLNAFVSQLPVLDAAENWHWDTNADTFASEPYISMRTKKVPRSHILYEATEKHPAQVEMYHEDVAVGQWRTIKFSGAVAAQDRNKMLQRIRRLQEAVKFAREQANNRDVEEVKTGDKILDYVFGAQS